MRKTRRLALIGVAIVATGGMSHQVHGERAGFNNTPWDMEFFELLENDPEKLTGMTTAEYARKGGWEGAEIIMWLVMRGAMSDRARRVHRHYYAPMTTGMGLITFEDAAG